MGQKTNPIIFRLGKIKEWELTHFEKTSNESSYYIFKEIEIQKFADKFFNNYGLKVKKCKIFLNERILHIFISYYVTEKSYYLISELNNQKKLKLISKNKIKKSLKKTIIKKKNYRFWTKFYKLKNIGNLQHYYNALSFSTKFHNSYRIVRNTNLELYKNTILNRCQNENYIYNNKFMCKFIQSLNKYLNISHNFTTLLTFKHFNKNLITQLNKKHSKIIKRIIPQLRRYQNNSFFNDGINIFFQSILNKQSQKLISEYIAAELEKLKRHSFFFRFIHTILTLIHKQKLSNIYGIKIQIKGRLNGAPRTKKKIINIGKSIKNLSLLSNINYYESTAYTKNGSFGVKTWISEKT